jgi:tryptophan halogenase
MSARYARVVDFLKMHYCLSKRRDSKFWIDNADPETISDSLKEKLAMWRCRPPQRLDFIADLELYLPASWQFVLYGMEYPTDIRASRARYPRYDEAAREFETIRQVSERAMRDLPLHRDLIDRVYAPVAA